MEALLRVEPSRRLVEQHKRRTADDGPRDARALAHATRQASHPLPRAIRKADVLQRGCTVASVRRSVVFPAPFGPSSAVVPAWSSIETSSSTDRRPYPCDKCSAMSMW